MAIEGQNRHYRWNTIRGRHWYETANKCRFDKNELKTIIDELCDPMENRIEWVVEKDTRWFSRRNCSKYI